MSGSKYFERIAVIVTVLTLMITIVLMNGTAFGIRAQARTMGYEDRLFDNTRVHTLDIVMNDWDDFIDNAASEEYYAANVVIDGEAYKNIGIRAKGNTSLSTVATLGSERYSFKIEFDHYDESKSYYGLDKLSLNNLIQDATMMKDYLTYTMMNGFGVNSSLCSYVYITVNGEDWGLYLAVEGVEDAFLERNYGADYGELYKPDSMSFGGGGGGMSSSDVKLQYIDEELSSYSNIWNNAKTDITEADQTRLIASLKKLSDNEEIETVVDIEQVIRYFVVHNYVCNGDSYTGSMVHNYYLYEKDGKLAMIPWDYNLAFGTFQGGNANSTVNTPIDAPVENGSGEDRPMWNWIVCSEEYTELYHQYFTEFLDSVDTDAIIDNAYALIKDYVVKDPTAFYDYEEFELGVETMRQFCSLRSESISMQLKNDETDSNKNYADASAITLSDMGSMGGGMGNSMRENKGTFGGGGMRENKDTSGDNGMRENKEISGDNGMRENKEMPENSGDTVPDFNREQPDGQFLDNQNMNMFPGNFNTDGEADMEFPSDMNMQMPEFGASVGTMKGEAPALNANESYVTEWIWLAVSVGVLVIGLFIAKKYRH